VHGRSTAATRLAGRQHGRHRSVCSARGRAARGDGVLGTDVGAGAVGPAVAVVYRRLCLVGRRPG
jgi:hypothetical protein